MLLGHQQIEKQLVRISEPGASATADQSHMYSMSSKRTCKYLSLNFGHPFAIFIITNASTFSHVSDFLTKIPKWCLMCFSHKFRFRTRILRLLSHSLCYVKRVHDLVLIWRLPNVQKLLVFIKICFLGMRESRCGSGGDEPARNRRRKIEQYFCTIFLLHHS